MNTILTILLSSILFTRINSVQCQKRVIPRNIIASVLQEVLSPANTEKAAQIIKMASTGNCKNMAMTDIPVQGIQRREMPVCMANDIGPKIVKKAVRKEIILQRQQMNDIPRLVVKEIPVQRIIMPEKRFSLPVIDTCAVPQNLKVTNYVAEDFLPRMPLAMANPFLPAASPISAFVPPTSASLPLPTQARGQFLRKIPIPPPTL